MTTVCDQPDVDEKVRVLRMQMRRLDMQRDRDRRFREDRRLDREREVLEAIERDVRGVRI